MDRDANLRLNSLQVEEMGELVRRFFADQGRPVRVSGYDVTFDDGTHGGLANLAQVLASTDRTSWMDAIEAHFTELAAATDRPASWEDAAPLVRLRLFAAGQFEEGAGSVLWPINDDISVALMIQAGGSSVPVPEMDLTDWHVKPDLSFDRALHNTLELEPFTEAVQHHDGGTEIHSITGGEFASARLLVMERHFDDAPHGAIVSIPNRHTILYHPIVDFTAVDAINVMLAETDRMYADDPHPLSSHVYWWKPGELVELPAVVDGDRIQFNPPADFIEALNEVVESTKRKKRLFRRD